MKLHKSLNTYATVMTSLSSMLGSGWLFSSFIAAHLSGPLSILAWPIGGLLISLIALCFSELSSSLPITGSIARYGQISHGPIVGFIISWLAWLSLVAVAPTEVQATLMYFSSYFDGLSYIENDLLVLTFKGKCVAIVLLFFFTLINYFGIEFISKLNNAFAIWKIIIPTLTSIILISTHHNFDHLTIHSTQTSLDGLFETISTVVIFSYLGFKEATEFGEEIKNPQSSIPIAVLGSVFFAVVFYMLIQFAFVISIPDAWIKDGWHQINVNGLAPFSNLAVSLGLAYLAKVVIADAVITPFSAIIIYTSITGRVTYAMSKNSYIPKFFSKLNMFGIPFNAIMLNFTMGCLLFYPLPSWQILLKFQSIAMIVAYLIGPITLVIFRETSPQLNRPFLLPYKNLIPILTCFACTMIIYWSGYVAINLLNNAILIGCIIFIGLLYITKNKILTRQCLMQSMWMIIYLLGMQLISYEGSFHHHDNLLSSGVEYICLFLLSSLCFFIAKKWHKDNDIINQEICDIIKN
ncbi:MAG: APC family permease [Gammaproteobacteria bacterium]|nr:APC family permease [Gammaproteobacteria bacterium]